MAGRQVRYKSMREVKRLLQKREEKGMTIKEASLLKRVRKLEAKCKALETWFMNIQERLLKVEGKI